jgi:2-polyprenyl-3-methyl-5-hydroxy-6-metoxy-1,4-benzoquinol methylase
MENEKTPIESPIVLPSDPVLPQLLAAGLVQHQANNLNEAEVIYNKFLQQSPEHPQAQAFLGALAAKKGENSTAIALLSKAIQGNPGLADPRYCLCCLLQEQGEMSQAVTSCTYAMALGHPNAKKRLESMLSKLGVEERARSSKILAHFYMTTNQKNAALEYSQEAIRLTPNDFYCWLLFSRCIAHRRFNAEVSSELLDNIAHAFTVKNIDYRLLTSPALSALSHDKQISSLLSIDDTDTSGVSFLRKCLRSGSLDVLLQNELFVRLLQSAVVTDIQFEKFLTSLREAVLWNLLDAQGGSEKHPDYLPLIANLAIQSFLNEYVWMASAEETAAVEQLATTVCDRINQKDAMTLQLVGILGAYFPLHRLPCAETVHTYNWPVEMADVIKMQVMEPLEEKRIQEDIPTISPVSGAVSQSVRSQYEENPFPRWKTLPVGGPQSSLEEIMARLFPFLGKEELNQSSHPQILVAGCGTGWIPNDLARHIRNASITALDLSLASLGYAKRKSKELGIRSIEYFHGDIQNASMLERQFDHINCYGVLHHMEEPQEGWRSLVNCLKPGGTMQIGLYSEIARQPVNRIRQHISELGYKPSIEDMRRCRQDIMERQSEPIFKSIASSISFYNMSEFRDLVFHAQEHQLTLPEIDEMLTELGLQFIGFQHDDPSAASRYHARFPQDPEMRSLELWHQFEMDNPNTFGNCYNFWVRKPA